MSNKERELNAISFAGDTLEDKKLWGTYVYWALEKARFGQTEGKTTSPAVVDDPINRVDDPFSFALQIIVFSAFALEYRVRRVLIYMHAEHQYDDKITPLLKDFWNRLSDVDRLDKKGKCSPPTQWNNCLKKLLELVGQRNNITHANYCEILSGAGTRLEKARQYYRSFIEAMRLINKGTGYQIRLDKEVEKDLKPLLPMYRA